MTTKKTATLDLFHDLEKQQPQDTQEPAPKKKYPPMTVYVPADQREIIEQIAAATGQTKHAVLAYAIRKVCRDWKNGIFPEMEVKPKFK